VIRAEKVLGLKSIGKNEWKCRNYDFGFAGKYQKGREDKRRS
jgi:hypothetical protein